MDERWTICRKCGIYDSENQVCNSKLYVEPEHNFVSTTPKEGYYKGCGCYMPRKIPKVTAHCPAKKW